MQCLETTAVKCRTLQRRSISTGDKDDIEDDKTYSQSTTASSCSCRMNNGFVSLPTPLSVRSPT